MVQRAREIDWEFLNGVSKVGITAGASAPEVLVEEVLDAIKERYEVEIEWVKVTEERVTFKLPPALTGQG